MASLPDMSDERVLDLLSKQMARYDAIVSRLASTGVQVKTWCVTAVGAISALAVNNKNSSLFAVGLAIVALFMLLDVFYLWLERRFRQGAFDLIHRVADGEVTHLREFFTNRPPPQSRRAAVGVVFSASIFPFYFMTTTLLVIGLLTT
jgi:uncharacterized membrane protein